MTASIESLGKARSPFLRASMAALAALVVISWIASDLAGPRLIGGSRSENLERFLHDVRPEPVRDGSFEIGKALSWAGDYMNKRGAAAVEKTLAISILAIVITGILSAVFCFFAARNFARADPYSPGPRAPNPLRRLAWWAVVSFTRALFLVQRAIPEYVWAFLLLLGLGPTAWTAVLALAIHNLGKLGRLYAETIENLPPAVPGALRTLGARRTQIAAFGILPAAIPRFLLYFFYRWESCVREATVLGMLGVVSLGYWIRESRSGGRYDEMLLLILLGAAIVIVGDLVSALARAAVRRAG